MPLARGSRFEKSSFDYATIFSNEPKNYNKSDTKSATAINSFTRSFNVHTASAHSVHWSNDGSMVGSASLDKTAVIQKLRPDSTKLVKYAVCKGHTSAVDQIAFSPMHPDIFATAAHDRTVRLWDSRVKDCMTNNEAIDVSTTLKPDDMETDQNTSSSRGKNLSNKERNEAMGGRETSSKPKDSSANSKRDREKSSDKDRDREKSKDRTPHDKDRDEKSRSSSKTNKDDMTDSHTDQNNNKNSDVDVLYATKRIDTKGENINLAWSPNAEFLCVGNKSDALSFIDMRGSSRHKKSKGPAVIKSHAFKIEVNEFSWDNSGKIFTVTTGSV